MGIGTHVLPCSSLGARIVILGILADVSPRDANCVALTHVVSAERLALSSSPSAAAGAARHPLGRAFEPEFRESNAKRRRTRAVSPEPTRGSTAPESSAPGTPSSGSPTSGLYHYRTGRTNRVGGGPLLWDKEGNPLPNE